MHIKILENCRADGIGMSRGEVYEVSDITGQALIRMGRAVQAQAPEPAPKSARRKKSGDV